jgi:ParB family transcriptional regulator, chromosome partitioning protein
MPKRGIQSSTSIGFIEDIDVSQIRQSRNIRKERLNIDELITSINQNGLLQPILVRSMTSYFEIVTGNRRFLACKSLGWRKITCHIVELDDRSAFEVSLIENIQRQTLSPLEEASAFKEYISEYGWGGISDLANRIGKSASYITKRIRLLDLPVDVLESIMNRSLCTSAAEELIPIKNKPEQSKLAALIIKRQMSLRTARNFLKNNDSDIDIETYHNNFYSRRIVIGEKAFDKTMSALRIAMNRISEIINDIESDWILYEILMQHKNMLHTQIDILIKEKRKLE